MTDEIIFPTKPIAGERPRTAERIPPEAFFICSAIFHYLGPAFAVLLFARVDVLGVAWLRIASAAVVFAVWKRPWRLFAELETRERRTVIALGFVLAIMNVCFYLAIDRLPLATVGTIEFLTNRAGGIRCADDAQSCRSTTRVWRGVPADQRANQWRADWIHFRICELRAVRSLHSAWASDRRERWPRRS